MLLLVFVFTWAIYSSLVFYVMHGNPNGKKPIGLNDAQINAIAKNGQINPLT